jgi:hypothetical protein
MADDVQVQFGGTISGLTSSIQQVTSSLGSLAGPVSALKESFAALGEVIAAAFAVREIANFITSMEQLAVETARASAILGVSKESVAGLDIAAKASGGSLQQLEMSAMRLGMALARAGAGSEQAKAGLAALGISAKDFIGLNTQDKLALLADKFSVLKDGTEKDAIAMALLGRAGAQMIPVFNEGSAAFKEFADMAERAGAKSFPEFEDAAHRSHLASLELEASVRGTGMAVFTIFGPAFTGLKQIMIDVVESFTKAIREGGMMKTLFEALAGSVNVLVTALAVAIAAIETLWTVTKAVGEAIGATFVALGRIIAAAMTGDLPGIKAAWGDLMTANHGIAVNAATEMESVFGKLVKEIKATWGLSADEQVKIEQNKNARMNILNKDAVSAAMSAAQTRIKLADTEYEATKSRLDNEFKLHQIGEGQKTASLLAALDVRHAAEMNALASEAAIHGLSATQYQKVMDERKIIDQKYANDRAKIIQQAALEEQKIWTTASNAIQSSFNAQLRGLLAGTTSFTQAGKAMLGDMIIKFIEMIEKWGMEWAVGQIAQLAVQQTTDAAKVTSAQAASAAAVPGKIAGFMSDLTARGALTFAGVFANLAPIMGPAAAGPAAASQGVVMAEAAAVPKFDVGTNLVLRGGLAVIHEGETIKPAQGSGPYTGANDGGGGDVHLHLHGLIDGASVQRFFKTHADLITRTLGNRSSIAPSSA